MRRLWDVPLPGAYELSEFAMGMMVFTTLAYCAVKGLHITVDVVASRFPARTQKILDAFIYFLSWMMMGVISWQLFARAMTIKEGNDTSYILGIQAYPFLFIAGLGCALLTLVFFTQSLDKISETVKK